VHLAGCTAHPDGQWVTQQARQLAWKFAERERSVRFLIRDHDRKFTGSFDAVFEAQRARIARQFRCRRLTGSRNGSSELPEPNVSIGF
jgi:hypothetical protein